MIKFIFCSSIFILQFFYSFGQSGALDLTFDPGTGTNNTINGVYLQSDGKIIIVGDFLTYNNIPRNGVARLNTDGSLDTTFNPGTGASSYVICAAIQNDGKILIGGSFTSYNGTAINRIARLNTDGTIDTSFHCGTGASDDVNAIVVQPDEKIIIGGVFYSYNGDFNFGIARLNSDGSLDSTFDSGQGSSGSVINIVLQNDGKMIVVGSFLTYNNISSRNIVRVNTDGSIDSTFDVGGGAIGTGFDLVFTAAVQSDGHILIGGFFDSYYTIPRKDIARLYDDGFIDISFDPGIGPGGGGISTILIQNDSKIIIGGNFFTYDSVPRKGIARLNFDGSLDTTFDPGSAVNGDVYAGTIQTDQKIIIGGNFYLYDSIPRNYIARIGNSTVGIDDIVNTTNFLNVYPNPITSGSVIESSITSNESEIVIYDMCGKIVLNKKMNGSIMPMEKEKLKSGIYLLQLKDDHNSYFRKIIVE